MAIRSFQHRGTVSGGTERWIASTGQPGSAEAGAFRAANSQLAHMCELTDEPYFPDSR